MNAPTPPAPTPADASPPVRVPTSGAITVVGLGPGDPAHLTLGALDALRAADRIYVRTTRHPLLTVDGRGEVAVDTPPSWFVGAYPHARPPEAGRGDPGGGYGDPPLRTSAPTAADAATLTLAGVELGPYRSFDALYDSLPTTDDVYRAIAETLVEAARGGARVAYAVPGSPAVAERAVDLLRDLVPAAGVALRVLPGVSALEAACVELGLDAVAPGLQSIDASELAGLLDARPSVATQLLNPTLPLLITGIWRPEVAADVKLFLLALYPAEWPATLVRAGIGADGATRQHDRVPLEEMDRGRRRGDRWDDGSAGLEPSSEQEQAPPDGDASGARRANGHPVDGDVGTDPRVRHGADAGGGRVGPPLLDHLTTLYVPPLPQDEPGAHFYGLAHLVARLRGPGGCPWDREQTHASLKRFLLEEAYEALEALDRDDPAALEEELGDVLLQVVLHAEIAAQDGEWEIGDAIRTLSAKLVRRHPHVFGAGRAASASEVVASWQEIKRQERAAPGEADPDADGGSALDGVPASLPALARAQDISDRAARTGFDWRDLDEVWAKVLEELEEVRTAAPEDRREELGDLLFVLVNWARFRGLDAEEALRLATLKFERRFRALERTVAARGRAVGALSMDELDAIWDEVKRGVGSL